MSDIAELIAELYTRDGYWRHAGYRRGKPLLRWTPCNLTDVCGLR